MTAPTGISTSPIHEIKALAAAGKLGNERVLTVRTGLDAALQNKAETVIEDMLRDKAPAYHAHQAATVIADHRRAGAGDGRRARLRREPVQPRHRRGAPARFVVQDFRLYDGASDRQVPRQHADRRVAGICIGDYCVHNYHGESGGIDAALSSAGGIAATPPRSGLSIKIGEAYWPPKQSYHLAKIAALGRSKIVETARAMGVTTPLVDTVSLPVGADEVKMIDMVAANADCSPTAASAPRPMRRSKSAIRAAS